MTDDRLREIRERQQALTRPIDALPGYNPHCTCGSAVPECRECEDVRLKYSARLHQFNTNAPADIDYLLAEVKRMGEVYRAAMAFYEAADEDMTSEETVDLFEACEKAREATK